jgi:hypothetical protein
MDLEQLPHKNPPSPPFKKGGKILSFPFVKGGREGFGVIEFMK